MANLNNKELIMQVIDEIMTDMFFLFPDLDDDGGHVPCKPNQEGAINVNIHFHTDFYLHFCFDRGLLHEMASNFLGIMPDEIDDEAIENIACEATNIFGGNYLVRVDPDHNHTLSIPEVLSMMPSDVTDYDSGWKVCFISDDQVMSITPKIRS